MDGGSTKILRNKFPESLDDNPTTRPRELRLASSEDSPQLKTKDLQEVSTQSKRKSPEPSIDEPRAKRKRKIFSSKQGPNTNTPEIWKDNGPNIIIPEAQKGKVRTPSPSDFDPPYFVGLAQGTTHIRSDPVVSAFHVPQGEGVSDRLGV
ncbi:hypothetical protein CJ030_MR6G029226 [Morella rubra]|uniref:Uncharacterized protein n=1 Tax=Morella rubra TaxID=262757 RepID=A0A6A1VAC3_9ROSI|nr:hypothetical protein CJ030_MR6G029226 [Morella rubra]